MAVTPPSAVGSSQPMGTLPIEEILGKDLDEQLKYYLQKKPQELTGKDSDGKTLLIKFAQANAKKCLFFLLQNHGEQLAKIVRESDTKGRTALHYLCVNAKPIPKELQKKEDIAVERLVGQILRMDERAYLGDATGWTPLHYAVSQQHLGLVKQIHAHKMGGLSPVEHEILFHAGTFTPLHLAACGDADCLLYVSGLTEQMNVADENGMMPLHHAVRSAHFEKNITHLLENGQDPDILDAFGRTAMSIALQQGNLKAAERLLERGANPGIGDPNPLLQCYLNGLTDFAKRLLATKKITPATLSFLLELATCRDDKPFVELLQVHGAKATATTEAINKLRQPRASRSLSLFSSQKLGPFSSGELSSKKHLEVKKDDPEGNTYLHDLAISSEIDFETLKQKTKGDDWEKTNKLGETPLLYCCRKGTVLQVMRLLTALPKVGAQDGQGSTIIHKALLAKNFVLFYFLLSQFKELINVPNARGETPFLLAVKLGDRLAVETLLKSGAGVKATDVEQNSALHLISQAEADVLPVIAIVDLLAKKIGLEVTNKVGKRPLNTAWEHRKSIVFKRLLDLKAEPDVADSAGNTLLMKVAQMNDRAAAETLVESGANRNFKGRDSTPLLLAVQGGHLDLVKLFLDKTKAVSKGKKKIAHPNRGLDHLTPVIAAIDGMARNPEKNKLLTEHYKILELLLKEGADANKTVKVVPGKETNPLTFAAEKNVPEAVALLLANKAKANNKAHGNRSPVVVAIKSGHIAVADLLIKAGAKASEELLREHKKNAAGKPITKVQEAIPYSEEEDDELSDKSETTTAVQSTNASAYSSQTVTPRGSPRSRGRYIVSAEEIAERLKRLAVDVNGTLEDDAMPRN